MDLRQDRRKSTLKLISGQSNPELAQEISSILDVPLTPVICKKFQNDNTFVKIMENVREKDVFIIQTSKEPVNDYLMELLMLIDAAKYSSAQRVTAVIPYYPYVRSDKKDQPRISITARLVADLLQAAGADRVLTMNLHSPQIQGFFRIPLDQLLAIPLMCSYFENSDMSNTTVVAPDAGSAKRAEMYAVKLRLPMAILDKRRIGNEDYAEVLNIIGEVKGKNAIIFDDEISTGGSLKETVLALKEHGAEKIRAAVVHPAFCGPAIDIINGLPLTEVIVTNTIPLSENKKSSKVKVLSVAELFANAIQRIHIGESVSSLFDIEKYA
jgi:ribose-phosphate pyrophosphokinase